MACAPLLIAAPAGYVEVPHTVDPLLLLELGNSSCNQILHLNQRHHQSKGAFLAVETEFLIPSNGERDQVHFMQFISLHSLHSLRWMDAGTWGGKRISIAAAHGILLFPGLFCLIWLRGEYGMSSTS